MKDKFGKRAVLIVNVVKKKELEMYFGNNTNDI